MGDFFLVGYLRTGLLNQPHYIYYNNGKIFLTDAGNNRILIYNSVPTSNNETPDIVIGQQDMISGSANQGGSPATNTISRAHKVIIHNGKLIVVDSNNHRALIYNSIPTSNNASADVVIGQADMTGGSANRGGSVSANTFYYVRDVTVANGKLIFVDPSNNRVLIYNSIPTSNGASADVVIGQQDMTSNSANQGGSVAANTLRYPTSVYYDESNGKLLIADANNHRVLIYNSIPTSNNASADVVIGQPDFVFGSANQGGDPAANTFAHPANIDKINNHYFISEWINNRVVVFNSLPTSNNASADYVLGQADFTSNSENRGGATAANTFAHPLGTYLVGSNKLMATDYSNHRALIFNLAPQNISINYPSTTTQATVTLNLTATDAKDMMISENSNFSGASWEIYSATKTHIFANEGNKKLYVKFRDYIDFESDTTTLSIVYDQTAPSNKRKTVKLVDGNQNNSSNRTAKQVLYTKNKRPTLKGKNSQAKNGTIKLYKKTKKGGTKYLKSVNINSNGSWKLKLPKSKKGKNIYYIKTYDQLGNVGSKSKAIIVDVDRDKPTFTNSLPSALSVKVGDKLSFPATDKQGKIKYYKLKIKGRKTRKQKEDYYIIPETLKPGNHLLQIKAYDKVGNKSRKFVLLKVK